MSELSEEQRYWLTQRGVANIVVESELLRRLDEGKPLRLKMGFDPSRPDLHLGHIVGLRKLRWLQDLGHRVILIVGDWTAQIGDPSGQTQTRTMLTAEEVQLNAETYMRQFFRVIDRERTEAVYQSEWFGTFTLSSVIELASRFTVNQFLHREDFARRYGAGHPVAVTELLYPLLQAYDSVAIQADVEFGGTDQLFNLLVGRELQAKLGQRPQQCFLMPLLPGLDGVRKMSKSLGNYIAVEDPPDDMYGKLMSVPDHLVPLYFELLTDMPASELVQLQTATTPRGNQIMDAKKRLAQEITVQFHPPSAVSRAADEFERVVQHGEAPSNIPTLPVRLGTGGVLELASDSVVVNWPAFLESIGLAPSRSQARRLIEQGAIELDGRRLPPTTSKHDHWSIPFGAVIRAGKRRFARVVRG